MKRVLGLALLFSAACGGGGGEPIEGTVAVDWGDDHVVPTVGSATEDTMAPEGSQNMLVFIGTRDIDCGTTLNSGFHTGTYVFFSVDRTTTGSYQPLVQVMRIDGDGAHINGSTGDVTIAMIGDERVTGDFAVATTDDQAGTITASGSFDVIRCF